MAPVFLLIQGALCTVEAMLAWSPCNLLLSSRHVGAFSGWLLFAETFPSNDAQPPQVTLRSLAICAGCIRLILENRLGMELVRLASMWLKDAKTLMANLSTLVLPESLCHNSSNPHPKQPKP